MTPATTPAELLPCPFCGNEASIVHHDNAFYAQCVEPRCGIEGPFRKTAAGASAAWNRRATPSPGKADAERWIPVMESSPMQGEAVLVAVEFDGPGDWRIKCGGFTEERAWKVFGASWTPSHWMPMPAAPGAIHRERDKQ